MSQRQLRRTRRSIENGSRSIPPPLVPSASFGTLEKATRGGYAKGKTTATKGGGGSIGARGVERARADRARPTFWRATINSRRVYPAASARAPNYAHTVHEYMHAKESAWLHWIRRGGIVSSSGSFESGEQALRGRLPTIFIAFLSRSGLPPFLSSSIRGHRIFFARAALRPRDVEEILGWMLVRVFQVFCVKILVIVVDVVDWEESWTRGRASIEWLSEMIARCKDSLLYSNNSNSCLCVPFLSLIVYRCICSIDARRFVVLIVPLSLWPRSNNFEGGTFSSARASRVEDPDRLVLFFERFWRPPCGKGFREKYHFGVCLFIQQVGRD